MPVIKKEIGRVLVTEMSAIYTSTAGSGESRYYLECQFVVIKISAYMLFGLLTWFLQLYFTCCLLLKCTVRMYKFHRYHRNKQIHSRVQIIQYFS